MCARHLLLRLLGPVLMTCPRLRSAGSGGVSIHELRELFNSIDVDGSGAIDADEMKTALELMGIHLSDENMAELMEGVDDDGSGELEFDEFVEIMTTKLGIGKPHERDWRKASRTALRRAFRN